MVTTIPYILELTKEDKPVRRRHKFVSLALSEDGVQRPELRLPQRVTAYVKSCLRLMTFIGTEVNGGVVTWPAADSEHRDAWVLQAVAEPLMQKSDVAGVVRFLDRVRSRGVIETMFSKHRWTKDTEWGPESHTLALNRPKIEAVCEVMGEAIAPDAHAALALWASYACNNGTYLSDTAIPLTSLLNSGGGVDFLTSHDFFRIVDEPCGGASSCLKTPEVIADEDSLIGALLQLRKRPLCGGSVVRGRLNEGQLAAAQTAVDQHITNLTGFAGTGKTEAELAIKQACAGAAVILTPSHASRRVAQVRVPGAATEVLQWAQYAHAGRQGPRAEQFDKAVRAQGGSLQTLFIDECGMADLGLISRVVSRFVRLYPSLCRIVFIGDPRQLRSVERGRLLQDMIDSGAFPNPHLTEVMRTDAGELAANPQRILRREAHNLRFDDTFIIHTDGNPAIVKDNYKNNKVPLECIDRVTDGRDAHIIAYKNVEVDAINRHIFERTFGRRKPEEHIFHTGVKLVAVARQPLSGGEEMLKGDMFTLAAMDALDDAQVRMTLKPWQRPGAACVSATFASKDDARRCLKTGYATTIHLIQGDECDAVVVVAVSANCGFFDAEAFYTAVTRARRRCDIVTVEGMRDVAAIIANTKNRDRYSTFAGVLRRRLGAFKRKCL
ncbi:P-loop containing nucleoside triphosphate hydrolase protein [Tribonema minus]|uniref:P-loop containing nucleoside triphosphate hydrolase protein n=1 Tax=Tribonema minus TaxID=303371 RepID=A0A835YWR9_9STRA|nr:P-loop containing nucleoside triphosphate hydrolase protein [Tribonema minus]